MFSSILFSLLLQSLRNNVGKSLGLPEVFCGIVLITSLVILMSESVFSRGCPNKLFAYLIIGFGMLNHKQLSCKPRDGGGSLHAVSMHVSSWWCLSSRRYDACLMVAAHFTHVRCMPRGGGSLDACTMYASWWRLSSRMYDACLMVAALFTHVRCMLAMGTTLILPTMEI